jgi:hypothetical protein
LRAIWAVSFTYGLGECYTYSDCHPRRNSYTYVQRNTNCYCNSHTRYNTESDSGAAIAAYSKAAAVDRIISLGPRLRRFLI